MPNLTYSIPDFQPFTKIISADVNTRFSDIRTLINTTKLDSTNVQQYGLTRDRLAQTTANSVLINDGSGTMSSESQLAISRGGLGTDLSGSLSANAGLAVIVNNSGNGFSVGSPLQGTLTESMSGLITTLTAGEAIAANAAVALDISVDGSNNNIYRVFNADYTASSRRRSFIGFAQAAATVTAGGYTWVASANFVTSNVITFSINGRPYTVNFSSNNTITLQAVATAMATDPDVNGAVSDGSHTVTVTGKGGLNINITGSTVTGGSSQATVTVTNTTPPVGQNVRIQVFGPLGGFSSLATGSQYYLNTAGGITSSPADTSPVLVGQALSSTYLFINTNVGSYQFSTPANFIRASGSNSGAASGGQTDVEHFNFLSWSAGVAATARWSVASSDMAFQSNAYQIDGFDAGGSNQATNRSYNKSSWTTQTNRSNPKNGSFGTTYGSFLYVVGGRQHSDSGIVNNIDRWSGSSWGNNVAVLTGSARIGGSGFTQGGLARFVGGSTGSGGDNTHTTFNGSSNGSDTVAPTSNVFTTGCNTVNGGVISGLSGNSTAAYQWSGSWSSSITMTYGPNNTASNSSTVDGRGHAGYYSGGNIAVVNGGYNGSITLNTSAAFNGVTWSSSTSSTNARSTGMSGVF